MAQFNRFQLSSYETDNPDMEETLLKAAIEQTAFWVENLNLSQEQKDQTQIFSGRTKRTKNEKAKFVVFSLIPLRDGDDFDVVWDAPLDTRGEDLTLKLEKTGIQETKAEVSEADREQGTH
jgi:hypothetical protein